MLKYFQDPRLALDHLILKGQRMEPFNYNLLQAIVKNAYRMGLVLNIYKYIKKKNFKLLVSKKQILF